MRRQRGHNTQNQLLISNKKGENMTLRLTAILARAFALAMASKSSAGDIVDTAMAGHFNTHQS
jgi:hypothetical protein